MTSISGAVIVVDLGKTRCRVQVRSDDGTQSVSTGVGAPGLAADHGVELAVAAIAPMLPPKPGTVVVGAAGALGDPLASVALAERLAGITGREVAVTSDVVTAHLGAFDGAAGTLLIAGTGSVAYHLSSSGSIRRAGGWGPWLGDEGSGQWMGRRGLASVLTVHDGRGIPTALTDAAAELTDLDDLPRWVSDGSPAARVARFAPAVLSAAEGGDAVATTIIREAIGHLRSLVLTARSGDDLPVGVTGGLTGSAFFLDLLLRDLASHDVIAAPAVGTALDGAAVLATRRDLPHEGHVQRA